MAVLCGVLENGRAEQPAGSGEEVMVCLAREHGNVRIFGRVLLAGDQHA